MGPISKLWGEGEVETPNAGAVGGQASELMRALIGLQPQAYATQATYGPKYTNLSLDQILKGVGGEGNTPGLSGIFSRSLPGIAGGVNDANTISRTGQVNDVANLGQSAASAIRGVNPGQTNILDELNDSALSGLKAGSTLAPQDVNRITSGVRGDWASRGLGTSSPAMLDEALQLFAGGEGVKQQRQQTAGSVAGLDNSLVTQPALSFLTQPSSAPLFGQNILGQAGAMAGPSGNTLTDPTSLLSGAYNANAAANIQTANNQAGLMSY